MATTKTRRAVLAGAAALPAFAASAAFANDNDPIFAAIERHKLTFRISQEHARVRSELRDDESAHCEAIKKADEVANDVADDAAFALTTVRPRTMAGLLALIHYVEAFNAGAFPDIPSWNADAILNWRSRPMCWPPVMDEDDDVDLFGYRILANVRCALETMAVQS